MESPNALPAHDFFTPAWLKIDPQVTKKSTQDVNPQPQPPGGETQHNRYTSNRRDLNNSTSSLSNDESRDRFNNTFHDSSQPYLSSRHNSFGSEQQFNNNPNAQTIGNNVNGFRNKKYIDSSQRPPFRPPYREKGSIAHHSTNKLNRNTDSFKPNFSSSLKKSFNKSFDYSLDNELNEKSAIKEENSNVFNQEFPSLVNNINGGQNERPNDNSSFHSAWTNTATKSKVLSTSKNLQLIHSSVNNFDNIDSSNRLDTNGGNASKPVITLTANRTISLITKPKISGILKENGSRMRPMLTKANAQTTPAMEILVKNPKKRSNKDFLNSIRNDQIRDKESDKDCNLLEDKLERLDISSDGRNNFDDSVLKTNSGQNNQMSYENDVKNAQNINNSYFCRQPEEYEDEDMGVLSSSLEAEHRLLMELGWKAEPDDDDPSYAPLTEDEVKEFKDLINARNGFKRNTTTNNTTLSNQTIHLNLSPKKWPTSDELDDEESTSSSDDD